MTAEEYAELLEQARLKDNTVIFLCAEVRREDMMIRPEQTLHHLRSHMKDALNDTFTKAREAL